jgi:chain length determinant protein EpsF
MRARLGVFALVLGATILAALAVSLLLPKTYKATASLLVDGKDEQSLSTTSHGFIHPLEKVNYMQTQLDIITSEKVARRVVRDLKLADDPEAQAQFAKSGAPGTIEDYLTRGLLEGLKIDTSQSDVMQVSFQAKSPRFAAAAANAFSKAYADTAAELRTEPSKRAAAWFDEQLDGLRKNVEDANIKLAEYQRKKGIVSIDERTDVEGARLAALSTQLARAQDSALDWRSRDQQARAAYQRGGSIDGMPEVGSSVVIQSLKADLLRGEAKLQEMAAQYGTNYPGYQHQASLNKGLRDRMNSEMQNIASGFGNTAQQSRQHEAALSGALAAQRDRLLQQREARSELAVLQRNVEGAQRTYEAALQRSMINKVDSRAREGNVTVLNAASAPLIPIRPRLGLNMMLAAVVGTLLALGTVVLIEMFDRRVRSRSDLAIRADVPLLGVLNAWDPARANLLPALPDSSPRYLLRS